MYDSLIAKLIVTGADRAQALARARRALAEFEIGGMPTVLPFHRAVVSDPAFTSEPFSVHTRWIETEFAGDIPPFVADGEPGSEGGPAGVGERERVLVEVNGKRFEVVVPGWLAGAGGAPGAPGGVGTGAAGRRPGGSGGSGASRGRGGRSRRGQGSAADGDTLVSPMQGTIIKIVAAQGQAVQAGETIVVLEAMKMEQPLTAHKAGTVSELAVEVGQTVSAGYAICKLAG
jgi:acetyl-CoA/propionyl-CoA carboxylase biotin carboxyl carrier protein